MTRWDKIGTTTGPTRIGDTVIPAGAELFIPIAEPGDVEDCEECDFVRDRYDPPVAENELFHLHLAWHPLPQVRCTLPVDPERHP